jgi:hypothetical protein
MSEPLCSQRPDEAVKDGPDIRFAQPREPGDESVVERGTVLERDQLAFALGKSRGEGGESGQVGAQLCCGLRTAIAGDVRRGIQRQVRTQTGAVVHPYVLGDLEEPGGKPREIVPLVRSRTPGAFEGA